MQNFMTRKTYQRLLEKLKHIKDVEITRVSKEKMEAARQGDLSENAEYEAAKEKLELLHSQFSQLEGRIANPSFIEDLSIPGTIVSLGTKVYLDNEDTGEEEFYTILGSEDSNADQNIISFQSPIAKGIIGKKVGDKCEIALPENTKRVTIKNIEVYCNS